MKTSEKIGIVIVTILAIILVSTLLANNKGNTKKDFCDKLCLQRGPENWFSIEEPMDENNGNNFSTKDECINACLLKRK